MQGRIAAAVPATPDRRTGDAKKACREGAAEAMVPGEGLEPPTFGLQNRCTTTVLTRRGGLVSEFCGLCQSLLSGAGLGHPTKSAALVPGIVPARVPYLFMARCRCSVIRWLYRIVMATVL